MISISNPPLPPLTEAPHPSTETMAEHEIRG